jgi:hypothetical protein
LLLTNFPGRRGDTRRRAFFSIVRRRPARDRDGWFWPQRASQSIAALSQVFRLALQFSVLQACTEEDAINAEK